MLLPSALSCDTSQYIPPRSRLHAALFASPPASPSLTTPGSIFATCRALQSMLSSPQQLPTPPMSSAPLPSPFKLRLRSRKESSSADNENSSQRLRKKIAKRTAPPRGVNKRRRELDDDGASDADEELDAPVQPLPTTTPKRIRLAPAALQLSLERPSTPKDIRPLPTALPLGLERADFQTLHREPHTPKSDDAFTMEESKPEESDKPDWTNEDDRLLVELVLEKLKLTKSDWQDCARSLGKDRGSVGKRWKSLVGGGEVGLKGRLRRAKIHATWR